MTHEPAGRHCMFDLHDVSADLLDDPERLAEAACAASLESGATVRAVFPQQFEPNGVSVLVVLSESHVSLHTYPGSGVALCDAFTCGDPNPVTIAESLAVHLGGRLRILALLTRGPASL